MQDNFEEIITPVGRLVMGDCFKPQTTDAEGRPLLIKNGPNAGQSRVEYYIGVAISKKDPAWPALYTKLTEVAKAAHPASFGPTGECTNPEFAFKIIDGDSQTANKKGVRPCDKIGFAGNWVLNFSNGFAPSCYTTGGEKKIVDPEMIKRGSYVRVYAQIKSNSSSQKPGIYLNHSMVEFAAYGEPIRSGPDAKKVFGQTPAQLPAGASATPVVTAPPIATSVTPPPPPAPEFLDPPPPPEASGSLKYKIGESVFSREQLIAAGYTDETIKTLPRV
jgi:hypothetical protein